jgi:hypothetical protein
MAGSVAGTTDRRDGRVLVRIDGENYFAARLIWQWVTGRAPNGLVDHEDRRSPRRSAAAAASAPLEAFKATRGHDRFRLEAVLHC